MNWLLDLTPDEWNAVRLSIKVATVAMLVSLPPGILIALLLARGQFWGKTLLNGLVHLPLILPPVVTGYLLLLDLRQARPGRRLPGRAFRHRLLVPLDRRGACLRRHGLSPDGAGDPAVDRGGRPQAGGGGGHARRQSALGVRHHHAAADPARADRRLPSCAFAKAMGEFGATITFVSNIPGETQTLPSAIYTFTQVPGGDEGALRLTLISIVISMAALVASEVLARRVGRRMDIE